MRTRRQPMRARLFGECASIVLPPIQGLDRWVTVGGGGRLAAPGGCDAVVGTRRGGVGDPEDKLDSPVLYSVRQDFGRCSNRRGGDRGRDRRRPALPFVLLGPALGVVEGAFDAFCPFLENANGRKHR